MSTETDRDESPDEVAARKLFLLKSPLVEDETTKPPVNTTAPDLSLFGDRFEANTTCPQFQRVRISLVLAY